MNKQELILLKELVLETEELEHAVYYGPKIDVNAEVASGLESMVRNLTMVYRNADTSIDPLGMDSFSAGILGVTLRMRRMIAFIRKLENE